MTSNLMKLYIIKTKKFIKEFTKNYLLEQYDESIAKEYIETYIDARLHNFKEGNQRFFYKRIHYSLMKRKKELKEENKRIDEKKLENNLKVYQYIYYIDGVRNIGDIKEFTKMICEKRISSFGLERVRGIEEKIFRMIRDYINEKEKFLNSFSSEDFSLKIEKYTLIDNTYKVDLDYRFKISYIYSKEVIKEVFDGGVINEDKLMIAYIMLTGQCINDINSGNFEKKYLVKFATSIYRKSKKIKQVIRIFDDTAIQDKIVLKADFNDFNENKEIIYELMREGFKFGVVLNETFNPTFIELKKLEMFQYILVPPECGCTEEIKENEKKIDNIVIYDS